MLYPDKLFAVRQGLSIYLPDPELVKPVYEQLLASDPETPFPFWAKIWPAARALCLFLEEAPAWIAGKQVLELGAGIGLPSLSIAGRAASIIVSDHASDAVALLEKNIEYLGLRHVKAMCIDWNDFPVTVKAQTLLLSDINYAPEQFAALLELIRDFLAQGTTIILSTPQRITITPFAKALQPFIRQSFVKTVDEINHSVDIRILILSA